MVLSIYPSPLCICVILIPQWIVSPHRKSLTFVFQTEDIEGHSLIRLHKKSEDDAVQTRVTIFGKVVKLKNSVEKMLPAHLEGFGKFWEGHGNALQGKVSHVHTYKYHLCLAIDGHIS